MNPLIQSYIAAGIRWLITLLVGLAVKHGADQAAANGAAALINPESISAFLVGVGSLAWSMWHKYNTNTKLATAAVTGISGAVPTAATAANVAAVSYQTKAVDSGTKTA